MILFEDISVVVQGPVDKIATRSCLNNIRRFLPGAQIILSTWKGSNTSGLDYDQLVLCQDPGNVLIDPVIGEYNNSNRQIYSTQKGLELADRFYTLKIRTDIILQDAAFLEYWDKYPKRNSSYALFEHRVLNYYLFAHRYKYQQGKKIPILFHPSDWMFFGYTQDIKTLFDMPLQPEPDSSRYWETHVKNSRLLDYSPGKLVRFDAEQHIFLNVIRRHFPEFSFEHYMDISREKEIFSKQLMVNNFIILDCGQWHIKMSKYRHLIGTFHYEFITHLIWKSDYKHYCDPSLEISFRDKLIRLLQYDWAGVLKAKLIACKHRFITTLCPDLYRKFIKKKYAQFPTKQKEKLAQVDSAREKYIYLEDIPNEKSN